jgi:hypothetical protein
VAAAALLLVAAASGCTADPDAPTRTSATTTTPTTGQDTADPDGARDREIAELLGRRAEAVRTRDRSAFAATLDRPESGFGLRQLAQFDALATLPLDEFAYGTPEPAPALGAERVAQLGPDARVIRVTGRYRLAGYDTAAREFESYFTVVRRGDTWRLADDTDGGTQTQLWDLPSFTTVKGRSTLVVGTGPAGRLRPYAALGDLAVTRVRKVWDSGWNDRLVLVVPGTAAQMAELVGQEAGSVNQVAAVTDGPFDLRGVAGADRVVVNPKAFASLERLGQQVVVTHEATHVAIRATTNRPVPLWLSEGMADYVGYRDIGASRAQVAAALFDRVRAGKGPTALPAPEDFDPSHTTIGPSYNAAWLAVHRIADRWGAAALVRFYRAAATSGASGTATDPDAATSAAFESVLHTSEAAFTRDWLASLKAQARE